MEITKQFTEDFFQLLALKNVYVTSHFVTLRIATKAVSMVKLSPAIPFKIQIDQFGQEVAKRTLFGSGLLSETR